MSTISSVLVRSSRFVQGGITEVGQVGLEWWARFQLPTDSSDQTYIVSEETSGRIDKIAYMFLDDAAKWWIIAQLNNILDPYGEIVPGRVLRIPTKERVQQLLIQKTGGLPTARGSESILPPIVL